MRGFRVQSKEQISKQRIHARRLAEDGDWSIAEYGIFRKVAEGAGGFSGYPGFTRASNKRTRPTRAHYRAPTRCAGRENRQTV